MALIDEGKLGGLKYRFATSHNRSHYDKLYFEEPIDALYMQLLNSIGWTLTGLHLFVDHIMIAGLVKSLKGVHSKKI